MAYVSSTYIGKEIKCGLFYMKQIILIRYKSYKCVKNSYKNSYISYSYSYKNSLQTCLSVSEAPFPCAIFFFFDFMKNGFKFLFLHL